MKPIRFLLGGLLVLALVLAGCESDTKTKTKSSDETVDETADDVTLTGTVSGSSSSALVMPFLLDPTEFKLFCVTFTDPPLSGSGDFDSKGSFSVTIEDAAGLPIGCFINNKLTNETVATISFTVGEASGFGDGTSSQAGFDGGTYEITINFDPDAGTATVDVSAIAVEVETDANFDPAAMVGSWIITCSADLSAEDTVACEEFLRDEDEPSAEATINVFIDVIYADLVAGGRIHAMGVWEDEAAYAAAGSTEAIPTANIPADIDGTTLASLISGGSATDAFSGFTSQTGYDRDTNTMSGDDVLAALTAESLAYDATFDDNDDGQCGSLDLAVQDDRFCLLDFLDRLRDFSDSAAVGLIPRLDSSAWDNFGSNTTATGTTAIQFEDELGSPAIISRFALMPMEIAGPSAIARQDESETYIDDTGMTCTFHFELTIIFTLKDDGSFTGNFTQGEFDTCADPTDPDGGGSYGSFDVDFNRPV